MLPFFQLTVFHIGVIPIQVWGFMVALGILCATFVAAKKAKRDGLNPEIVWDAAFWLIVGAGIGARVFMVVYEPAVYLMHPPELLRIWEGGFSEMGGILGALVALAAYFRHRLKDVWGYLGAMAYALPLGLGIGRIGCFLIHDHPGTLTHFLLGVRYPDGVRHDHGLYLSLEGFLLFLLFVWLDRKHAKPQTFVFGFFLLHGCVRFGLDFLRAVDVRYLFLTPAQFVSIGMIGIGTYYAVWWHRKERGKEKST